MDESLLAAWNHNPPYHNAEPEDNDAEAYFTVSLVDALLGHNLRVEYESRWLQVARYHLGETDGVLNELDKFILTELDQWPHYKVQASACSPGCHKEVANMLLFWHAYVVHLRYLEDQALENRDVSHLH